jgi:hypothetical protein
VDRGVFEVAVGGDGLKNFCIDSPTAATELMNEERGDRAEFEIGGVEVGALLRHRLCIPKIPSSGFPSNVTLLLPGRLLNPGSSSIPHVVDFNGIRRGWDLRDTQLHSSRKRQLCVGMRESIGSAYTSAFSVLAFTAIYPRKCYATTNFLEPDFWGLSQKVP